MQAKNKLGLRGFTKGVVFCFSPFTFKTSESQAENAFLLHHMNFT